MKVEHGLPGTAEHRQPVLVAADIHRPAAVDQLQALGEVADDVRRDRPQVARRAAALCVSCEQAEAEMVAGGKIDIGEFTTAANSLRRLLSDLGLERRAKDITPSLEKYLARGLAKPAESTTQGNVA